MARRFRFRTVDVFTDRPFTGNPLAVFPDAEGLTDDEMLAVAREMNLSETSFVLPPTDEGRAQGADYRVRFFTPGMELPFAGHPSIGTAWVLASENRFDLKPPATEVRQELPIGVLPLSLRVKDLDPGPGIEPQVGEITMTQGDLEVIHRLDEGAIDDLCEDLEIMREDIGWPDLPRAVPIVLSTGLPHLVVPLRSREIMEGIDRERAGEAVGQIIAEIGAMAIALVAPGGSGAISDADASVRLLESRRLRIEVDPATGSAAGPIGVLLGRAARTAGATYRVVLEQGTDIGRPSRLVAEADFDRDGRPTEVRVAGCAVAVIEGWVTLP